MTAESSTWSKSPVLKLTVALLFLQNLQSFHFSISSVKSLQSLISFKKFKARPYVLYHKWRNRGGRGGGGAGPPTFVSGGTLGGLIYAFTSTILPLHECVWNLIGLPSKLKPRKELKSRNVFLKILFVGWGEQKLKARTVGLKPT